MSRYLAGCIGGIRNRKKSIPERGCRDLRMEQVSGLHVSVCGEGAEMFGVVSDGWCYRGRQKVRSFQSFDAMSTKLGLKTP